MRFIIIFFYIFLFTVYGEQLKYNELVNIVFNKTNTIKISKLKSSSKSFKWVPANNMKKKIYKHIDKFFNLFKVSLLKEICIQKNSVVYLFFTVSYGDCHSCGPLILASSINLKTKKVLTPLKYITILGNSGEGVSAQYINLGDDINGIFLFGSFTNQSFTIFSTELISLYKNKITKVFSFSQEGQTYKCDITSITDENQIQYIIKSNIAKRENLMATDYANEFNYENYDLFSNQFCDIFIEKLQNKMPIIYKAISSYEKRIYHNKNRTIVIKYLGTQKTKYSYKNGKYEN